MSSRIYVRVRGRTIGPISVSQARGMVRRGQLSRVHEVSLDGTQWQPASDFPELFQLETASGTEPRTADTNNSPKRNDDHLPARKDSLDGHSPPSPQPEKREEWFYARDGQQVGPISKHELVALFQTGQLAPETYVWHESLKEWQTASSIPGLVPVSQPVVPAQLQPAQQTQVVSANMVFCRQCGSQIYATAVICPKCGTATGTQGPVALSRDRYAVMNTPPKSRVAYVLLAFFAGLLGIHNFYAGYVGRGVVQLLLSLTGIGVFVTAVWVIIEMIVVTEDANRVPFT